VVSRSRIVRVLAPNASPMTLEGTNSYLVLGGRDAIAIDPGPADASHVDALVATAAAHGARIAVIALTHDHPDHAPGADLLRARTGAPVFAHPASRFGADRQIDEGERLEAGDAVLEAYFTPGHASDHLAFALEEEAALFTGDVVIGRGTVVVAPPNGDMRAYQATLQRLRRERESTRVLFGGHGERIDDPRAKFDEYIAHRELREREILAALEGRERTVPELVAEIYRSVSPVLWPAAARQIVAYLIALEREGRVRERLLTRAPTAAEAAVLNPDLSRIADAATAAVARAELGFDDDADRIAGYVRI
jgi:glyoxylase-like metal-dependent hydrolase (beta-lactamase superfamily II)